LTNVSTSEKLVFMSAATIVVPAEKSFVTANVAI
jgi:hypothetical protein